MCQINSDPMLSQVGFLVTFNCSPVDEITKFQTIKDEEEKKKGRIFFLFFDRKSLSTKTDWLRDRKESQIIGKPDLR